MDRLILSMFVDDDDDDDDDQITNAVLDDLAAEEEMLWLLICDEEGIERRPKNENYLQVVDRYDDDRFKTHFRVSRSLARQLGSSYEASRYFSNQASQYGKLMGWEQILVFLWFVGHQTASFRDVADRFDITISSLYRINVRLIYFISSLGDEVIRWPDEAEKAEIESEFRRRGFPNVIGAVDGSHVRIDKPQFDPDAYYNRKKFHSVQVQVACDHRMRIRSMFVGFPGSVHDARVFSRSDLGRNVAAKCGHYVILADSAYPCSRHVIPPFKDLGNLTRQHKNFNKAHSRARVVVEHCFGLLKQRFRQLYHLKLRSIRNICHFVRACCVLHNLALDDRLDEPVEVERETELPPPTDDDPGADEMTGTADGLAYRNYLLRTLP